MCIELCVVAQLAAWFPAVVRLALANETDPPQAVAITGDASIIVSVLPDLLPPAAGHKRRLGVPASHVHATLPVVARQKTDDDATKSLREDDQTQDAPKGTKVGLLKKSQVMGDFAKVARAKKK